jgi:hypothetical protein
VEGTKMPRYKSQKGVALLASIIFMAIFTTWLVSVNSTTNVNLQLASNQHKVNLAISAAESGLEFGRFIISLYEPITTNDGDDVTQDQANDTWQALCQHIRDALNSVPSLMDGQSVGNPTYFSDGGGGGLELVIPEINFGSYDTGFQLRMYRYDSDLYTIKFQAIGSRGTVARKIGIDLAIKKDTTVLKYAVASKSRVIITGDSTIEGDIYSPWNLPNIAPPFEMDDQAVVNGTINTVIGKHYFNPEDDDYVGYTLETLDEDGNPMFDEYGNRIHSPGDKIQGTHQGINYDQPVLEPAGFQASDFDTSVYDSQTSYISMEDCDTVTEYFPHAAGDYTQRESWGSRTLNRKIVEDQVISDGKLPVGTDALFRNCTFENLLYIEGGDSSFNNVRFENCTFNGAIVTDVPSDFYWQKNVLYFTGSALFDNQYMEEGTILAPNFNVNIGNTQELEEESESILQGLIVGGIVDVRGNATIHGTILSTYEPPAVAGSAAYGTNVGFSDENNESGIPEDIGTIHIYPDPDGMLPLGVISDVIVVPVGQTYIEN